MIINDDGKTREVPGLSKEEKAKILTFLQGAVYCWCKNRKGEWFAMSDLMGGDNRNWEATPLQFLCDRHTQDGKTADEAFDAAGKESGWLLKEVVRKDKREFETRRTAIHREYRWQEG